MGSPACWCPRPLPGYLAGVEGGGLCPPPRSWSLGPQSPSGLGPADDFLPHWGRLSSHSEGFFICKTRVLMAPSAQNGREEGIN